MYAYSFGYTSYEESPEYILLHEEEFTTEEFLELIAEGAESVVQTWLGLSVEGTRGVPKKMVSSHYWLSPLDRFDVLGRFSTVTQAVACWLIENRGFKPVEPRATARFDGWARLLPDLDGFPFVHDHPANVAVSDRISSLSAQIAERNDRIRNRIAEEEEEELARLREEAEEND